MIKMMSMDQDVKKVSGKDIRGISINVINEEND